MITRQERQFLHWSIGAFLLISLLVYAALGEGYRVFVDYDKNLSTQDSKKMATIMANPRKLEKMLLATVVKDPKDSMAWQWLTRLYTQQEKWQQAAQCAEKAWLLTDSAQNLMIWCHALKKSDRKKWQSMKTTLASYQKKYPQHQGLWDKIMREDSVETAGAAS